MTSVDGLWYPPHMTLWWLVASSGLIVMVIGSVFAFIRTRKRLATPLVDDDLRITVLKPMAGLDPDVEQNLESFARLQAPASFQVVLCIESERDPAFEVATAFAAKHPERFEVVAGRRTDLLNPKIAQLSSAWHRVRNPFVWISDANVETSQAFMEELARVWKNGNLKERKKTLVHAPLVGVGGTGLSAAFERMHLSSLQNPNHEVSLAFKFNAVVGKAEFFHREDIEALGGLERFGPFLAEDFVKGQVFAKEGQVLCTSIATRNVLGAVPFSTWFDRHTRWGVLRKTLVPFPFYVLEPTINLGMPAGLAAFGLIPPSFFGVLVLTRMLIDATNYSMQTRERPRVTDVLLVPLKEAFLFAAWLRANFTASVQWRNNTRIVVGRESKVVVKSDSPPPPDSKQQLTAAMEKR